MKVGVPKEIREGERRVAMSPDVVKRFAAKGVEVVIEHHAGAGASLADEKFVAAGARIAPDAAGVYAEADVVLKVARPMTAGDGAEDELAKIKPGTVLIGLLRPYESGPAIEAYAEHGLTAFAMESIPRITRAQGMDALSSQSNLVGYKAAIDAADAFGKAMPMMMTAAGTIAAAKVLVLGAGVAGLQAIATARRLGGVVSAFDVRAAVKEQVESLGAKFVEVESAETETAETAGGYAREMSEDYKRLQSERIHETLKKMNIAISTALIPGRPAPVLITEEMVRDMPNGAVIVDIAAEAGGNCALTEPGSVIERHGVTIIGHTNYPARIAVDASALYARNLFNFLDPHIDAESKTFAIDWEDEIVQGALVARDGAVVNPAPAS
jgi:H+-translocating NAD(P) transhydrogenase subunit alpha